MHRTFKHNGKIVESSMYVWVAKKNQSKNGEKEKLMKRKVVLKKVLCVFLISFAKQEHKKRNKKNKEEVKKKFKTLKS